MILDEGTEAGADLRAAPMREEKAKAKAKASARLKRQAQRS